MTALRPAAALPAPAARRPVLLGAAGLAAVLLLSGDDGPVLCPFRRCTGLDCPGCGMSRSAGRLLRGDVAGAFDAHLLGPILALQAVLVAMAVIGWRWRPSLRVVLAIVVVNAVAVHGWWLLRLTSGDLGPTPLG